MTEVTNRLRNCASRDNTMAITYQIEKPQLTLGFIPLTDCAPLVIAREKGLFDKYGLDVSLSKETSWANIRDKLAIGVVQDPAVAHQRPAPALDDDFAGRQDAVLERHGVPR